MKHILLCRQLHGGDGGTICPVGAGVKHLAVLDKSLKQDTPSAPPWLPLDGALNANIGTVGSEGGLAKLDL